MRTQKPKQETQTTPRRWRERAFHESVSVHYDDNARPTHRTGHTLRRTLDRARLQHAAVDVQRGADLKHPLMRRRTKALRQAWRRGRLANVAKAINAMAGTSMRLRRAGA